MQRASNQPRVGAGSALAIVVLAAASALAMAALPPSDVVASRSDMNTRVAVLSWAAPANGTVARYAVEATPRGPTFHTTTTAVESPELTYFATYHFLVRAEFDNGDMSEPAVSNALSFVDRMQWRKEGVDIPGATEPTLHLNDTSAETYGLYHLIVWNAAGVHTSKPVQVATPLPAVVSTSGPAVSVYVNEPLVLHVTARGEEDVCPTL